MQTYSAEIALFSLEFTRVWKRTPSFGSLRPTAGHRSHPIKWELNCLRSIQQDYCAYTSKAILKHEYILFQPFNTFIYQEILIFKYVMEFENNTLFLLITDNE